MKKNPAPEEAAQIFEVKTRLGEQRLSEITAAFLPAFIKTHRLCVAPLGLEIVFGLNPPFTASRPAGRYAFRVG